ncbi:MAG: PQQ-dependent sugar dehydrogenase [Pseudomonadota bacterium]|nr:PQQ-dependent sugar dehydrogenase [Pseudomonadota bacterium]
MRARTWLVCLAAVPSIVCLAAVPSIAGSAWAAPRAAEPCDAEDNAGLRLPPGFCATLFAKGVSGARQLAVAPNGDVFVASKTGDGVWVLRDTDGDGQADDKERFVDGFRASHVAVFEGWLYVDHQPSKPGAEPTRIERYPLEPGTLEPAGPPETIVADLPSGPGHKTRNFAITPEGTLYVNVGSQTNACQPLEEDREADVPGLDPCRQLETTAGIWRFDARQTGQTQAEGEHYARGIRNAVAIATHPADDTLWVVQHGRDDLGEWKRLGFTATDNAELPAEELLHVNRGDDYGWPYCYFDPRREVRVLAPEYGGDGQTIGRCVAFDANVGWFPAHWAPNAMAFYTGSDFPPRYRDGVFVAFHGSWNRAPLPQQGFNVVFQPLRNGRADGPFEVFADGFAPDPDRDDASNSRPTGLAEGPDGALYVSDDARGRIWKIVYAGE